MRNLALSFDEATEYPHFEKTAFKVKNKIFATLDISRKRVCLKLTPVNQSVFSACDPRIIYPVPNKWGRAGWTFVVLKDVRKAVLHDALTHSYCAVAPPKLANRYRHLTGE